MTQYLGCFSRLASGYKLVVDNSIVAIDSIDESLMRQEASGMMHCVKLVNPSFSFKRIVRILFINPRWIFEFVLNLSESFVPGVSARIILPV